MAKDAPGMRGYRICNEDGETPSEAWRHPCGDNREKIWS